MEQIYTIPVNEAFDAGLAEGACTCPFCALYKKLQEDELDIILGASMMEPDIRIMTNRQGFCPTHFKKMLSRKRRLGMGLMLESHLPEVQKRLRGTPLSRLSSVHSLLTLEQDCYVCTRIDKNLTAMIATAVYLYETDEAFRKKFAGQPYFCLPHYRMMIDYASKKMNKRDFKEFFPVAEGIVSAYLEALQKDVSWFCKKFDYRYDEEPWYNSKDSIERSIRFLSSDNGEIE
ncbi:MAG: hypothetical protein J6J66_03255 [Clostridia bacterium]|nr:hypothetical protein [Clostridia bacterium]